MNPDEEDLATERRLNQAIADRCEDLHWDNWERAAFDLVEDQLDTGKWNFRLVLSQKDYPQVKLSRILFPWR